MDASIVLTIVNIVCTVVIGIAAFVFRRAVTKYDSLEKLALKLDKRVAILWDRDRRRRSTDYPPESEDG